MEQKHSAKREAILDCIRQTRCHPSAEWIYNQLKPKIPGLSLATVYRNLSLFRAQGLVASVGTVDGLERFDGNPAPHTHFLCECCGDIHDLPELSVPAEFSDRAAELLTCTVSAASLIFRGRCPKCSENTQ